jgi:Uncharacterized protein conserved in bacteria
MRHLLSVALCVIVSLVLLGICIRYISGFWLFTTLHSLQLHLSLLCVIALALALLLHRTMLAALLLAASLGLAGHAAWMMQDLAQDGGAGAGSPVLRLMSFNILMDNIENAPAIRDAILGSGADVVNIMEAAPLKSELAALAAVYPYRIGCGEMTKRCDLMVLSKTPLENRSIHSLSTVFEERMIVSALSWQGTTIHLAAIHTTKPYFDSFQTHELVSAAQVLERLEGPLLVSGDFNASSLAPNIRMFLRWTGLRTALWEPATWPEWAGRLGVPIDHVYVREPLRIRTLERLASSFGSNHHGLMAEIVLERP